MGSLVLSLNKKMTKLFQIVLIFGIFAAITSKSFNNVAEEDESEEYYYDDYYQDAYDYLEDEDSNEDDFESNEGYGDDEEVEEFQGNEEGEKFEGNEEDGDEGYGRSGSEEYEYEWVYYYD